MLRSDLCDQSDVFIVVKRVIDLSAAAANENDKAEKDVAFKNNAPFRSCISKINNPLIDNAEDPDIVMSMYNLLEYTDSYLMTSRRFWNYNRDKSNYIDDNASESGIFELS